MQQKKQKQRQQQQQQQQQPQQQQPQSSGIMKRQNLLAASVARSAGGDEMPLQKKHSELDDIAHEISKELDRKEAAATRSASRGASLNLRKKKSKRRKKKRKPEPIRFEFTKFKFVEPVDDQYVMEYGLSRDEIMNYRKNHFNLLKEPKIMVRETKTSEMKEEFGTYCGVKKTIKNWLFWV